MPPACRAAWLTFTTPTAASTSDATWRWSRSSRCSRPRSSWHRGESDEIVLKSLIERHFKFTGSEKARAILDQWDTARTRFVKVFPTEYKRALGEMHAARQKKMDQERATA